MLKLLLVVINNNDWFCEDNHWLDGVFSPSNHHEPRWTVIKLSCCCRSSLPELTNQHRSGPTIFSQFIHCLLVLLDSTSKSEPVKLGNSYQLSTCPLEKNCNIRPTGGWKMAVPFPTTKPSRNAGWSSYVRLAGNICWPTLRGFGTGLQVEFLRGEPGSASCQAVLAKMGNATFKSMIDEVRMPGCGPEKLGST